MPRSQAALRRSDISDTSTDARSQLAQEVIAGLASTPKRLPPKYFYDEAGAELFERITTTPEYYPTRCELGILQTHAEAIASYIPRGAALVELGSGASKKARILIAAAPWIVAYVPVDISTKMLSREARSLQRDRPGLQVLPVEADFTGSFALPAEVAGFSRIGFFPGSTIGNFEPREARDFLRHVGSILGRGACLIIGVDLVKDAAILNAAYDDAAGITARFNLNLLTRMNRELNANFESASFCHRAFYDSARNRVEMHLASKKHQKVRVAGRTIEFRLGETIHTENSYKYSLDSFAALARGAGWTAVSAWVDPDAFFSIHALKFEPA
jgi:dimethylhistidine N-methyltransferase